MSLCLGLPLISLKARSKILHMFAIARGDIALGDFSWHVAYNRGLQGPFGWSNPALPHPMFVQGDKNFPGLLAWLAPNLPSNSSFVSLWLALGAELH